jgi:choline dehydrogenase
MRPRSDRSVEQAAIEEDIRARAATFFHPNGTCRMGSDQTAVVDPRLRVIGLQGLRVADASIMPAALNACTHAPTIMIGEKGRRHDSRGFVTRRA